MTQIVQTPIFGRKPELETIRTRLRDRNPFLLHGPAGIGKTLLIRTAIEGVPDVIYCPQAKSPQVIFNAISDFIASTGRRSDRPKSVIGMKGVVLDFLRTRSVTLGLDHLVCPSSAVASSVRELMRAGAAVVSVARSAHMEDAGHLLPLYPFREERIEIRPFDPRAALEFSDLIASSLGIAAANRDELLARVVEYGKGNPGAIIAMLRKAVEPRYRTGDHIKIAPLYVDFRLEWNATS